MKSLPLTLGLAVAMIGGSALSQSPAARPAPAAGPSLALSMEMAQAAMASCKASGYTVAVSVVDSAGVLRLLTAADGAGAGPVGSSTRKANASLKYKESSASLQEKIKTDTALDAAIKADASLMPRAGAQVLMSKGAVIGAIGVGGAPGGEKDDACALAAIAAVKDKL